MANNMCSMCGGSSGSMGPNYAKLVDPSPKRYGPFMEHVLDRENDNKRSFSPNSSSRGGQMQNLQMCISGMGGGSQSSAGHHHAASQQPGANFVCEPCPPPPPTKIWLIKSSPAPQKSVCCPVGKSDQGCPPTKLMLCLPCPPPGAIFPAPQAQCSTAQVVRKNGGKYLPPPQGRICSPNCIHVTDIKAERQCTWHQNVPCVAHCFNTPP